MKQIENASIGGYAFSFEEEAAKAVSSYLKNMSVHYPNPEIMEGIEERMAELLLERTPKNGVVSLATVQEIMNILGKPERIEEEEPERTSASEGKPRKKLYRDLENARIAGVCGGLGEYLNFDATALRIIFVVLTLAGVFGGISIGTPFTSSFFPFLYVILWICMPAARTARQRWELKGEDGSAESIRRTIENGAAEVSDALQKVGKDPAWGTVGRVMEVVFGLLLLIIAISGLFAGALGLFGWEWLGMKGSINELIREINYEWPQFETIIGTVWVKYLLIAVYTLPFLGMLYGSIMMLFHFKSPSWHPGLVIFILWLIAIVALAILIGAVALSANMQTPIIHWV